MKYVRYLTSTANPVRAWVSNASRWALVMTIAPSAADEDVPLTKPRPSFGPSLIGFRPASASAWGAGRTFPSRSMRMSGFPSMLPAM